VPSGAIRAATWSSVERSRPALGGSGQHLAMGIDDIGKGRLADLRIAKEIREEAQINVGDSDAVVEAGMRH
jgi:hypothetical protein